MFGRLFFFLVLLAVSFYIVKYLRSKLDDAQHSDKESENNSDKKNQDTKKLMVKCQHCGLHIPEKEAIKKGDKIFCSLRHAKKGL